jgi:hypothetical protein
MARQRREVRPAVRTAELGQREAPAQLLAYVGTFAGQAQLNRIDMTHSRQPAVGFAARLGQSIEQVFAVGDGDQTRSCGSHHRPGIPKSDVTRKAPLDGVRVASAK